MQATTPVNEVSAELPVASFNELALDRRVLRDGWQVLPLPVHRGDAAASHASFPD